MWAQASGSFSILRSLFFVRRRNGSLGKCHRNCRGKYGLNLIRGEIQAIDFKGEHFDNVTVFTFSNMCPIRDWSLSAARSS